MTYEELKKRQRRERDHFSDSLGLRVHRAISWIQAFEKSTKDLDGQFIQLWIAFNALYAQSARDESRLSETQMYKGFIAELVKLDQHAKLSDLVWNQFASSIRGILKNPYIYGYFWRFHNGKCTQAEWQARFQAANQSAKQALAKQDTAKTLSVVLSRLYVLRNQILHGGATWNGSVNRDQVKTAVKLLSMLVPTMVGIMMDHPRIDWPTAAYPVIKA